MVPKQNYFLKRNYPRVIQNENNLTHTIETNKWIQ